jgi:hypothetical protein
MSKETFSRSVHRFRAIPGIGWTLFLSCGHTKDSKAQEPPSKTTCLDCKAQAKAGQLNGEGGGT